MVKRLFLVFLVMISVSFAAVTLNYPTEVTIDDSLFLGKIAPDQLLELRFSRETGPSGTDKSIFWEVISIPDNLVVNNTLDGNEIVAWIRVPSDIRGLYSFDITAQGPLGNLTIEDQTKEIVIEVTEDVYEINYDNYFATKAGEVLEVPIIITSSSIAREELSLIESEGIPLKWVAFDKIKFEGVGEKQVIAEIIPNEEGIYETKLKLGRKSSSFVNLMEIDLRVYPTIKSKLRAFGEGFSISPIIMQPFYSFLSLFGLA